MIGFGIYELFVILSILSIIFGIFVLVFGPIAKKAGFSRWWALLLGLPIIGLIAIWIFSFIKWPVEKT